MPGHRAGPGQRRAGRAARAEIRAEDHAGVEDLDQGLEVPGPCRRQEGVDHPALQRDVAVRLRGGLHPAAGPAGELAGRVRAAVDHPGDLVERHREDVVQDEREALGRAEALQHDQQRESDRVGQHRLLLRPALAGLADQRLGQPAAYCVLAPGLAGPQHVEADPPDHGGQPCPQVIDGAGVAVAEPQPGLLHRVLRLADRAEHAVGDRLQVLAVLLELLGQPALFGHRSFLTSMSRRPQDVPAPSFVTALQVDSGSRTGPPGARRGDRPLSAPMLLRGGLVADGIGAATAPGDVLIDGPVIAAIGAGDPPAGCEVIDLPPGSVVCPGFIDAHAHAEGPLLAAGRVDGALAQGVTTLVVGQDGQSWIGATAATARYLNRYFAPVNGALDPPRSLSLAGYREAVAGRLTQNVAVLASQGTIRHNVAGLTRRPLDPAERAAARREVENALAEGAVGLSSGLDYLPSRFGAAGEIADIARPLAGAQRPYVSHLRAYGGDVGSGLDELVAVGRGAGVRVHASHLCGSPAGIAAAFRAADAAGVGVSYDMYPYRRSSTILASLLLPPDLQAHGPEHTLAALADPRERAALLAGDKFTDQYLQNVYLGRVPASAAELAGQPVTRAAAARGSRPAGEWVVDLLIEAGLNVGGHLDRPALSDGDLAWLMSGERHCAGSDGIYQGQHPHPRGYATFARLVAHYLSAGPETGYQRAARHLSANAADVYGLRDRGRLAPGMAADICVIGPGGLTARATYDAPRELAAGVDLVIVNGAVTWREGRALTAGFPGQVVS